MSNRVPVTLACTICNARNYKTTRAIKPGQKPLELKKHCHTCNAHTIHRETK